MVAEALDAASVPRLSEAWAVEQRHAGFYTGGKVVWSDAAQRLCCLYNEEICLVSLSGQAPSRTVGHEGDGVLTFAIDTSGVNACASHRSGLLRHFRLESAGATMVCSWKAHEQVVADVCFDSTGSFVASGSVDRTAKVWDFAGHFCTHNFRGHPSIVKLVRFHPAQLQLVTIADPEVRLWDLQSSTCVGIMKDHLASISSMCFAKVDDKTYQLVTGARDQVVNLWNLAAKRSKVQTVAVFESVEGVAIIPMKVLRSKVTTDTVGNAQFLEYLRTKPAATHVIVTVGDKGLLRAWNPEDGKCVGSEASPHAAKGAFRQVHLLSGASGMKLLTVGEDLNFVIWSLPELQVASYFMGHNEEIVHVQLIPSYTWPNADNDDEDAPVVHGRQVSADRFVCISNDEHPRVVECQGFKCSLLRGHTDVVIACDVSVDGLWIATGGKDQTARVWDAETCHCVATLLGHAGAIAALSFTKRAPKGPNLMTDESLRVVSASHDKTMKIWELPSSKRLRALASERDAPTVVKKSNVTVIAHAKDVSDVLVAPNNKLIASAGMDKLVRVWSFPGGDLLGECKGHRRGVWCVAFSPIDQVLASASGDGTVRLWSLKDYSAIRAFQGHTGPVLRVAFLANGMQLMSSSVDGLLKLWHIRTADCVTSLEEHEGKVWCIDVVGNRMVSGGSDSKLCVWKDVTVERAAEKHKEEAEVAMKDSAISRLVHEGKIERALTMALDLNRPAQIRQILLDHAAETVGHCLSREPDGAHIGGAGIAGGSGAAAISKASGTPDADVDEQNEATIKIAAVDLRRWVVSLTSAQVDKLVTLLEQWNSNRKMASLAHVLIGILLLEVPLSRLGAMEGANAICSSVLSYSSRHMVRVESLLQKTFVLDLVLQSGSHGLAPGEEADTIAGSQKALERTMEVLLGGIDAATGVGADLPAPVWGKKPQLSSAAAEVGSDDDEVIVTRGACKDAGIGFPGAGANGAAEDEEAVHAGGGMGNNVAADVDGEQPRPRKRRKRVIS